MNQQDIEPKESQNKQKCPQINEYNPIEMNYAIPYSYQCQPVQYISTSQVVSFMPLQYTYPNYQNNPQFEYGNIHHIYPMSAIQNSQKNFIQSQQYNSYPERCYQPQAQPMQLYAVYPQEVNNTQFQSISHLDQSKTQSNERDRAMYGQLVQNGENYYQKNIQEQKGLQEQNDQDIRRSFNINQKEESLNIKRKNDSTQQSYVIQINQQQNNEFDNQQNPYLDQQSTNSFKPKEIQQEDVPVKYTMKPSNHCAKENLQNKRKQDKNFQFEQINFITKEENEGSVKDIISKKFKTSNIKNSSLGQIEQNEKHSLSESPQNINFNCKQRQSSQIVNERNLRQNLKIEQIKCDDYDNKEKEIQINQIQIQNNKNIKGKDNSNDKKQMTFQKSVNRIQKNKNNRQKSEENELNFKKINDNIDRIKYHQPFKNQQISNDFISDQINDINTEQSHLFKEKLLQMKEENAINPNIIIKNERFESNISDFWINHTLKTEAVQFLEEDNRQKEQIYETVNSKIYNNQSSLNDDRSHQNSINEQRLANKDVIKVEHIPENPQQEQKQDYFNINKYKDEILSGATIEEFNLIKQVLSINKQNANKNIIKAFQKYVNQTQKHLYEYKKESKNEYYYKICQHEEIMKNENPSQKERTKFFKKFNKFISNKTYTNSNIKQIIQNRIYGQILFAEFLQKQAYAWLEEANVVKKEQYKVIIEFYKLCCSNQDYLLFLSDNNSVQNFNFYQYFPNLKNKTLITESLQNEDQAKNEVSDKLDGENEK